MDVLTCNKIGGTFKNKKCYISSDESIKLLGKPKVEKIYINHTPDTNYPYPDESGSELEYIGIIARAQIKIPLGNKNWRLHEITSGGLWGIEVPYEDKEDIHEIEKEQIEDLERNLKSFGIDKFNAPVEIVYVHGM